MLVMLVFSLEKLVVFISTAHFVLCDPGAVSGRELGRFAVFPLTHVGLAVVALDIGKVGDGGGARAGAAL